MKNFTMAQIAYEAYRKFAAGKSLVTGSPIPEWDGLSMAIKDAWFEAADAVLNAHHIAETSGAHSDRPSA